MCWAGIRFVRQHSPLSASVVTLLKVHMTRFYKNGVTVSVAFPLRQGRFRCEGMKNAPT